MGLLTFDRNDADAFELKITADAKGSKAEQAYMRFRSMAEIRTGAGERFRIPITGVQGLEDRWVLTGESNNISIRSTWTLIASAVTYFEVDNEIQYNGMEHEDFAIRFECGIMGQGKPTWMIPGAFYKENRFKHNLRKYPRYDYEGGDPDEMVSDHWSFRADRATLPAIFAWNDGFCGVLCVEETSSLGINGIGFRGNAEGTSIWADFPYQEEPVVFAGDAVPRAADCPTFRFTPGQTVRLSFKVHAADPNPHAYDPFIRAMYAQDQIKHQLNPWMGLEKAAELTAHGLFRWHYNPEHHILNETAAFDREFNNNVKGLGDRQHMHVGWVSGSPYAYALLTYGRNQGIGEYADAAIDVLDMIASGLAPNGTFWGSWVLGKGWGTAWNPNRNWLQARTIAEATLFMIRALRFEKERGIEHPEWERAVVSNLQFALEHQREDGNFGSYYHCETGHVEEWDGAGGILWIAPLLEGGRLFNRHDYSDAAVRAGSYYSRFVEAEYIYGAPEDVHLTPTSEDAYNAVVAYVLLYEQDNNQDWLRLARSAADWMMTFRWSYNIEFPKHSLLAQYDYRSRGADQASTSNQHLHNYGLFCLPEMLRLWTYTGDRYYLERTRDHLCCFLQFIAREDGDFNAYKGMVTERFYNTNCFQPKGMMLTLSHSWCVGLILYASQEALPYETELALALPPNE